MHFALTPEELGGDAFRVTASVLGVTGLVFGVRLSRSGRVSPKSALGFAALSAAWLVLPLAAILGKWTGWRSLAAAATALKLVGWVLLVAALVLGILGIIDHYVRPRRWSSGAWLGWVATLFLPVVVTSSAVSVGTAIAREARRQPLAPPAGAIKDASGRWVYSAMNYAFSPPGEAGWHLKPQSNGGSDQILFIEKHFSGRTFQVLPERFEPSFRTDSDGLANFAIQRLRANNRAFALESRGPKTMGRLTGVTFVATVGQGLGMGKVIQFCGVRNGWGYQMIYVGPASSPSLRREADDMFARVSLIDGNLAAPGWEMVAGDEYRSVNFGFSIRLEGRSWAPTFGEEKLKAQPFEFAANTGSNLFLAVIPTALPTGPISGDALRKALLARTGLGADEGQFYDRSQKQERGFTVDSWSVDRLDASAPLAYRCRLIQGRAAAYLVLAGGERASATAAALDALLDRVATEDIVRAPYRLMPDRCQRTTGIVLNALGLEEYGAKRFERAASIFRQAEDAYPPEPLFAANECDALAAQKRYSEVLTRLDERSALAATNVLLRLKRANAQHHTGKTNEACETYQGVFAEGFDRFRSFTPYVELLVAAGRTNDAVKAASDFAAAHPTAEAVNFRSALFNLLGRFREAADVAQEAIRRGGLTESLGYTAVDAQIGLGDSENALKLCDDIEARGWLTPMLWRLRGRAQAQRGRYDEARTSLEAAIALDPNNPELMREIAGLSATLGQGDNAGIRKEIAAVDLPGGFTGIPPDPLPAGELSGQPGQYLDRSTVILYRRNQEWRKTERFRADIYDEHGVSLFGTLRFDFDSTGEEIFINDLTVRDATGAVVGRGRVEDYFVSDGAIKGATGAATWRKYLNAPAPGLRAGCSIEATVTTRRLGAPNTFPWFSDYFERLTPAARILVAVTGDVSNVRWAAPPEVETSRGEGWISWSRTHAPPWVSEPLEPVASAGRPRLVVADASLSWGRIATDYLGEIAGKLSAGPDATAAARAAVSGKSAEARIRALVKLVQDRCSYRAIEFGTRARVPKTGAETWNYSTGDCKDQAVLLRALLATNGISAHLALVNPGEALITNVPSFDQFDHMVVFVPDAGSGQFIDPTIRKFDPFLATRLAIGGGSAFILDPGNPRFCPVPFLAPDDSKLTVRRRVSVTNSVDVEVSDSVTATGVAAGVLRSILTGAEGASQRNEAQRWAAIYNNAIEIDSISVSGMEDSAAPLELNVTARLRDQLQRVGPRLAGALPAPWEAGFLNGGAPAKLRRPMEIRSPVLLRTAVRLDAPVGFRAPARSSFVTRQNGDFVTFAATIPESGEPETLQVEATIRAGLFSPDRADERRAALRDALRAFEPAVVFEPTAP